MQENWTYLLRDSSSQGGKNWLVKMHYWPLAADLSRWHDLWLSLRWLWGWIRCRRDRGEGRGYRTGRGG